MYVYEVIPGIYKFFSLNLESFHRSNQFHFAVLGSNQYYKLWKKKFLKKACKCQE